MSVARGCCCEFACDDSNPCGFINGPGIVCTCIELTDVVMSECVTDRVNKNDDYALWWWWQNGVYGTSGRIRERWELIQQSRYEPDGSDCIYVGNFAYGYSEFSGAPYYQFCGCGPEYDFRPNYWGSFNNIPLLQIYTTKTWRVEAEIVFTSATTVEAVVAIIGTDSFRTPSINVSHPWYHEIFRGSGTVPTNWVDSAGVPTSVITITNDYTSGNIGDVLGVSSVKPSDWFWENTIDGCDNPDAYTPLALKSLVMGHSGTLKIGSGFGDSLAGTPCRRTGLFWDDTTSTDISPDSPETCLCAEDPVPPEPPEPPIVFPPPPVPPDPPEIEVPPPPPPGPPEPWIEGTRLFQLVDCCDGSNTTLWVLGPRSTPVIAGKLDGQCYALRKPGRLTLPSGGTLAGAIVDMTDTTESPSGCLTLKNTVGCNCIYQLAPCDATETTIFTDDDLSDVVGDTIYRTSDELCYDVTNVEEDGQTLVSIGSFTVVTDCDDAACEVAAPCTCPSGLASSYTVTFTLEVTHACGSTTFSDVTQEVFVGDPCSWLDDTGGEVYVGSYTCSGGFDVILTSVSVSLITSGTCRWSVGFGSDSTERETGDDPTGSYPDIIGGGPSGAYDITNISVS